MLRRVESSLPQRMFGSTDGWNASHTNLRGAGGALAPVEVFDGTSISGIGWSRSGTFQEAVLFPVKEQCLAVHGFACASRCRRRSRDSLGRTSVRSPCVVDADPGMSCLRCQRVDPVARLLQSFCPLFLSHHTVMSVLHSMRFHSPGLECLPCLAVESTAVWRLLVASC